MTRNILILLNFVFSFSAIGQADTLFTYFQNKNIRSKTYSKEKKIIEKIFFENGQLKIDAILNKDSIPVELTELDEEGNIRKKLTKRLLIEYAPKYNAVMHYKLKNGKLHGTAKTYEGDKLSYKMHYKKGISHVAAIGYDTKTNEIIAKENYTNGKLNGEGFYYKRGNILQRKIFYKDGCPYKAQVFDENKNVVYETSNKSEINKKFRSTEFCP